jgi:hypothetical protein
MPGDTIADGSDPAVKVLVIDDRQCSGTRSPSSSSRI